MTTDLRHPVAPRFEPYMVPTLADTTDAEPRVGWYFAGDDGRPRGPYHTYADAMHAQCPEDNE